MSWKFSWTKERITCREKYTSKGLKYASRNFYLVSGSPKEEKTIRPLLVAQKKSAIETAPKKVFIYESRIKTGVQPEHIVEELRLVFPEISCEQLDSKYPEHYSSFKVSINLDNFDKALRSDI